MKVSKTKVPLNDGTHALYINVLDFRDEVEWETMARKIEDLVRDARGRTKVF